MVRTFVPSSWRHLQELLFDEPFAASANTYHSGLIHRGMVDARWDPLTSIERHGLWAMERHLLRNFQKYATTRPTNDGLSWEWLVLGQHHGLPTRLLDWTYSPLVALHFATLDVASPVDGVVWSLDYVQAHDRLPQNVKAALDDDATAFTTNMLDRAGIQFDPDAHQSIDDAYLLVIEPPSLDERIVNQYAGFSAMSSSTVSTAEWLATLGDQVAVKIEIPAALKPEIREKLDKSNVNERVIYPGLDGLAQWLTRYYKSPPRAWLPAKGFAD